MKENHYFPPKCNVLIVMHQQCVCESVATGSNEDFEVELVEY